MFDLTGSIQLWKKVASVPDCDILDIFCGPQDGPAQCSSLIGKGSGVKMIKDHLLQLSVNFLRHKHTVGSGNQYYYDKVLLKTSYNHVSIFPTPNIGSHY